MLDIDDWMISCNKQINQFRKTQFQNFWTKILSGDIDQSVSGPPSSSFSEEGKSQGLSSKKEGEDDDSQNDLLKYKS